MKRFVWMLAILAFCGLAVAQDQSATIKKVPVAQTSPASGEEMFKTYCAVCHGTDGKGNGPAASALKNAPADLTTLAKINGGKFPAMKVSSTIEGQSNIPVHGTQEMPIWGQLFWGLSHGHGAEVQQRVGNLTTYIESLQAK